MIVRPEVIAKLSGEDLRAWQAWLARDDAMQLKPDSYTRDEVEGHFRQRISLLAEFITRYGVVDSPYLAVTGCHGNLYYERDEA